MNRERAFRFPGLLRVVFGLLFFRAGALKVFGWFGGMPGGRLLPCFPRPGSAASSSSSAES